MALFEQVGAGGVSERIAAGSVRPVRAFLARLRVPGLPVVLRVFPDIADHGRSVGEDQAVDTFLAGAVQPFRPCEHPPGTERGTHGTGQAVPSGICALHIPESATGFAHLAATSEAPMATG